jgi:hypothetical protein
MGNMGSETAIKGLDPTCGISDKTLRLGRDLEWKTPGPLNVHNQAQTLISS